MTFPFEYDHGVPLAFGGALPTSRRSTIAHRHPAGPRGSHDVVRVRNAQRPARDPAGVVAHGAVGRGSRRGRPRRRHLHAARDGTAVRRDGAGDGRNPARRVRDSGARQVPGDASAASTPSRRRSSRRRPPPPRDSRSCRSMRTPICATATWGRRTITPARCAAAWSTRGSRRSASAACPPKRPRPRRPGHDHLLRRDDAPDPTLDRPRRRALSGPVYITIDVDGMDPAIMPATGTPEPGGLSWYQILALLRATIARRTVVACDIVELSPIAGAHGAELPLRQAHLQDPDVSVCENECLAVRVRGSRVRS